MRQTQERLSSDVSKQEPSGDCAVTCEQAHRRFGLASRSPPRSPGGVVAHEEQPPPEDSPLRLNT
ncbi:hypothetical protein PsorP6_010390 [Peronosclerospora sorghi]|uniref:Uncharacterized protein n=1 Tax=Peronosclerospora sorghi TaxID=230839 RepID=A0ACC0VUL5_9STRA|nr:hypothetical protein PsorP6_010390 [Peronosclerospora sorghi]